MLIGMNVPELLERSMAGSGFPEDLVIEILSRLPVKSLLRFRCVCKSWCTLVENPSFISKHKNTIGRGTTSIFFKRRIHNKDDFMFLSNETLEVSENLDLQYFPENCRLNLKAVGYYNGIDLQYFPENCRVNLKAVGCYNGIICLVNGWNDDIILWNPSTRQSKVAPKSPPLPPNSFCCTLEIGFGYDFKTNDFKVVFFRKIRRPNLPFEERTDIYSLNTDSWRLSDAKLPGSVIFIPMPHNTCVNGIFCRWGYVTEYRSVDDEVLFSFDMSDETFQVTPLPEFDVPQDPDYNEFYHKSFAELNESVGLIQFVCLRYEIWVLNEYGSKGSWTKLYTIGPIPLLYTPLGFWKNSELFMESDVGELVLYDPITQEIKKLQLDEEPRRMEVFSYKESLVSLKGGNHLA